MRFTNFRTLTEADLQRLDELRMNPKTLTKFAHSPEAEGIMAGFEAELAFRGLGGDGDDFDMEPDYDSDERCYSIQQVMDFFENDEWGYGTHGRDARSLQEGLDEKYWEWHEDQMYQDFRNDADSLIRDKLEEEFDREEFIRDWIRDNYSDDEAHEAFEAWREGNSLRGAEKDAYIKEHPAYEYYREANDAADDDLSERVDDSVRRQDEYWDEALDEFRDDYSISDDSGFFTDVGLRYMSNVADEFNLMWPIMRGGGGSDGGWSEYNAERLADDLHEKLGIKTKVSSGYHSAKRDSETWIFEPDSSLEPDDDEDMTVEIVSPPMPLLDCLAKMEKFFIWAESNGAYANQSTGFHMGVSLPGRGGDVDYVKLALFLGDEHVLEEFGRSGNTYCAAAIKKIKQRVGNNKEAVAGALDMMKHGLIELAQKALEISNQGFGKYTSINPQGGRDSNDPSQRQGAKYIEFRSAGGVNEHGEGYFEDIKKLQNTLMRYAQAMHVASRPDLNRDEYYKKLYKFISPKEGDPALDLFAKFSTGEISSADLKAQWADKALSKEPTGNWVLYDEQGKRVPGQTYSDYTKSEAWEKAWKEIAPGATLKGFRAAYKLLPSNSETGDWEVYNPETGKTLEVLRGFETRGAAADSVYDKYADQNIPFNLRPVEAGEPEKPLSPREKLAKNIKSAPAEEIKNWKVYDTKTGEVHYEQEGRKSNLVQAMRKFEIDQKLPRGRLAIEEIPMKEKGDWDVIYKPTGRVIDSILKVSKDEAEQLLSKVAQQHDFKNADDLEIKAKTETNSANDTLRKWEIVNATTGLVVATYPDLTLARANEVKASWESRLGAGNAILRSVPTDASAERVAQRDNSPRMDYEIYSDTTGRVVDIMRNASAAEVLRQIEHHERNGVTPGDLRVRTFNPQPAQQQTPAATGQATASNGVPIWEIYNITNGTVVHTIADHNEREAQNQARSWLQSAGVTNASDYKLRAKVNAPVSESWLTAWEDELNEMTKPISKWIK